MLTKIEAGRFEPDEEPYGEPEQLRWVPRKWRRHFPNYQGPKGRMELSLGGHSIELDLAKIDLATIPALWQESFSARERSPQVLHRFRELLAVEVTNSPEGYRVKQTAWLCGVLPPTPVPEWIIRERDTALADELSIAASNKAYAEKLAAIEAAIVAFGIQLVDQSEKIIHTGQVVFGQEICDATWYYDLKAASGARYRFSDRNEWSGERPIVPIYEPARECSACEVDENGGVFFTTGGEGQKVKHFLSLEESAAYHWVKNNGRGKSSEGQGWSL